MTLFQLWLVTCILPSLNCWALVVFWCTTVAFGVYSAAMFFSQLGDDEKKPLNWKPWVVVWIISGIICSAVPSKEDLYLIAGGYVATNTKDVEKLPANFVSAANAWLEKTAKESNKTTK